MQNELCSRKFVLDEVSDWQQKGPLMIRKPKYLRVRRFLEVTKVILTIIWLILLIVLKLIEVF